MKPTWPHILSALLVTAAIALGASEPSFLNVRDFGAKGDGRSDDTAAFQKALDTAREAGAIQATHGTVLIRGCDFQEDRQHIDLGEGVQRAIISANLTPKKLHMTNHSQGVVKVDNNTGD